MRKLKFTILYRIPLAFCEILVNHISVLRKISRFFINLLHLKKKTQKICKSVAVDKPLYFNAYSKDAKEDKKSLVFFCGCFGIRLAL